MSLLLTIDTVAINFVVDNSSNLVENGYIQRVRNLDLALITWKLASSNKKVEKINLTAVSGTTYAYLETKNGLDVTAILTGAGTSHNFNGTYNLDLEDGRNKSYNDTQKVTITLHKT